MDRVTCQQCGKEFEAHTYKVRRGHGKFCSVECKRLDARGDTTTRGEPRAAQGRSEIRRCPICSAEYRVKASHVRRGWGAYCSQACQYRGMKTGETRPCTHCGKPIYRPAGQIQKSSTGYLFCNRSCRASYFNKDRAGANHPNWKSGHSVYRDTLSRSGATPLCRRCAQDDARVLAVHHLDGDRANNAVENLVWVCHNCHHLIHHYPEEMAAFGEFLALTGL